jgi:hypothetical protein
MEYAEYCFSRVEMTHAQRNAARGETLEHYNPADYVLYTLEELTQ